MNPEIIQIEAKAKAFKFDYERLQFLKHQHALFNEQYQKLDKFEKPLRAELELYFRAESKTSKEAEQKALTSKKYTEHLNNQITAERNLLDIKALIAGLQAKMEHEKMDKMQEMSERKIINHHN